MKVSRAKRTSKSKPLTQEEVGLKYGFRSGLEDQIAEELTSQGVSFTFEEKVIEYLKPARKVKYTPDFELPNGIIIETKGRFVTADRQKHLLVKEQRPDLDIRFIFNNPNTRISKQSKTTYAMWCEKHGFKFAKAATIAQRKKGAQSIPQEWIEER